MNRRAWPALVLTLTLALAACGGSSPPTPSVPAGGGPETINGTERLGWDQLADGAAELASIGWAVYVDGARAGLGDVSCAATAAGGRFPCSGRLPPLTAGAHTLQIVSFFTDDPSAESGRSAALQVVVRASATAVSSSPATAWPSGMAETADGSRTRVERLADGLLEPTDAAFAPDGRLFVAERRGVVAVVGGSPMRPIERSRLDDVESDRANGLLGLALDPDFERTHHVFAVYTAGRGGRAVFQLARFREVQGRLGERAILLDGIPADPARPSAALRFGPDRLLYLALDDGGEPDAAADPSSSNGKLLRLTRDGRTPSDQPSGSPVFWSGLRSPRGLAFDSAGIWLSDVENPALGRLTGLGVEPGPPPRAVVLFSDVLAAGAAGVLAPAGAAARDRWRDVLWMASADEQVLMRLRPRPGRPLENGDLLLQRRVGPIRVVLAGPDGAVFFCTDTAIGRLLPD